MGVYIQVYCGCIVEGYWQVEISLRVKGKKVERRFRGEARSRASLTIWGLELASPRLNPGSRRIIVCLRQEE